MKIQHALDSFFFTLFPELMGGGNDLITSSLRNYYTFGNIVPVVSIQDNSVIVELDINRIISQETDYKKVIALCEKGKFTEAKPILKNLIDSNPSVSEYHRILGQILSEEGNQEEAINCLIDALKWDSKNGWALLMMGNIFAKYKKEIPTALKYYDQAIVANPSDFIGMVNIGYLLFEQNENDSAKKYLYKALKINDQYPNAHLALALIAKKENDLQSAFYSMIQAIKYCKIKDVVYEKAIEHTFGVAEQIVETEVGKKIFREYRHKLEFEGDKGIDIINDETIPNAAKIEFAEIYKRDKHLVKYKSSFSAVEHLIMHELVHLDFAIQARKNGQNQLFTSKPSHKELFTKKIEPTLKKLKLMNLPDEAINRYSNSLFEGLNSQIYNTPIDLFIEDFLYNEFPELRSYQFISLHSMLLNGIEAVTDSKIMDLSPKEIISQSKTYNLVHALQFKALFGIDKLSAFKASPKELQLANDFYKEFEEYKVDKEPAEEYELIQHWAEDLNLDQYFELISEKGFRANSTRNDIDQLLSAIENDPFELETHDPKKEREMQKFQASQTTETNMAVVMYMVDALQFFETQRQENIKSIALEIAFLGTHGFNPQKEGYKLSSIPGKTFSGYHILAYYYISWALALPEKLHELQLPFDKEYEMAKQMNSN